MTAPNEALAYAIHESRIGEVIALTMDDCRQIVEVVENFNQALYDELADLRWMREGLEK